MGLNIIGDSMLSGPVAGPIVAEVLQANNLAYPGAWLGNFQYHVVASNLRNHPNNPSLILMIINNMGRQADFFKDRYRGLIGLVAKHSTNVVLCTMWRPAFYDDWLQVLRDRHGLENTRTIEQYNCDVALLSSEFGFPIIDGFRYQFDDNLYHSDGLHLLEEGSRRLANLLKADLDRVL